MSAYDEKAFDKVFHDITDSAPPVFDSLIILAQNTLKTSVRKWCREESALCGGAYEDDLMQEILIRLVKYCVSGFFIREGKLNYDPLGFKNWMFAVARNVKSDFAKKIRHQQFIETELDENIAAPSCTGDTDFSDSEERLTKAFSRVIDSDLSVYKVLTWVAQMLIIANMNVTKIESNRIIEERCGFLTLDAMLEMIIAGAKDIPWLKLNHEQISRLRRHLDEKSAEGDRLGDKQYSEFFMKKGPRASISDWVNRINNYILKEDE